MKKTIFILLLALTFSNCQTDNDLNMDTLEKKNIENRAVNQLDIPTSYNTITVVYELGTTEIERKEIRARYFPELNVFTYTICPSNPYMELWHIPSTPTSIIINSTTPIKNEDEVDRVDLGNTCN